MIDKTMSGHKLSNLDDLVQIRDGVWKGRRWSWQNTDSYAYPVHLYMHQPGKISLVICGLNPQREANLHH